MKTIIALLTLFTALAIQAEPLIMKSSSNEDYNKPCTFKNGEYVLLDYFLDYKVLDRKFATLPLDTQQNVVKLMVLVECKLTLASLSSEVLQRNKDKVCEKIQHNINTIQPDFAISKFTITQMTFSAPTTVVNAPTPATPSTVIVPMSIEPILPYLVIVIGLFVLGAGILSVILKKTPKERK